MGVRSSICVCVCAFVRACVKDRVRRRCKDRGMMSSRHSGHKFKLDPEFIAMREKKISASTLENKIEPMLYFLDFEQKSHKLKLGKCKCGA